MTVDGRPAGAYLHGLHGPVCLVSGRVADWLLTRTELDRLRKEHRGADPEVDAQLLALTHVALAYRTSDSTSAVGSSVAPEPEAVPQSSWVGTAQAADLLGITDRAIRLAIDEHRLPAEKVDGRWRITREDVEHYAAARAA